MHILFNFMVWLKFSSIFRSYFLDQVVGKLEHSFEICDARKMVAEVKIDMITKSVDQACKERCFFKARKFLNEDALSVIKALSSICRGCACLADCQLFQITLVLKLCLHRLELLNFQKCGNWIKSRISKKYNKHNFQFISMRTANICTPNLARMMQFSSSIFRKTTTEIGIKMRA